MASTHSAPAEAEEHCGRCEMDRAHAVSIDLVTENGTAENASFSREPYRIAECLHCGATTRTRMNDA